MHCQPKTMVVEDSVVSDTPGAAEPGNLRVQDKRRRTNSKGNSVIRFGIFYLTLLLFAFEDFLNIGAGQTDELVTATVLWIFNYADLALFLILGYCIAFDRSFQACVFGRVGRAFLAFIAGYYILGVIFGNQVEYIYRDLRIWGWGFAGLALFRALMRFRHPCAHILAICFGSAAIMVASALSAKSQMTLQASLDSERVWDLDVFRYAEILVPLLGILLGIGALRPVYLAGALVALAADFYACVLMAATRSLALSLAIVCICAALGCAYKRNQQSITARLGGPGVWIAIVVLGAVVLIAATLIGTAFSDSTALASRLAGDDDNGRIEELMDALRQLGPFKTITGGGLGYVFESTVGYTSLTLHIGTFIFLLKFGVVPFALIVLLLYVYLPCKFLQALFRPLAFNPNFRSALLIVLPGIFAWIAVLSISGGYDVYCSVTLGLLVGVFGEIRRTGFTRLLPAGLGFAGLRL